MKTDHYTKAVLTVIALCLVWMSLGGPSLLPVVGAQQTATEVVVVGWRDSKGETWRLPVTYTPPEWGPSGKLTFVEQGRLLEERRAAGLSVPVDGR